MFSLNARSRNSFCLTRQVNEKSTTYPYKLLVHLCSPFAPECFFGFAENVFDPILSPLPLVFQFYATSTQLLCFFTACYLFTHDIFSCHSTIKLWALTGQPLLDMIGHSSLVYSVDAHSSGLIASGSEDRSLKIWKGDIFCILTKCIGISLSNSCNLTKLVCDPFYKLSCLKKCKVVGLWLTECLDTSPLSALSSILKLIYSRPELVL